MRKKRNILLSTLYKTVDDKLRENDAKSPQRHGEEFVGGSTPDVESDDDVLKNVHDMGLYESSDYEHPKKLGLGEEINKAEAYHRTH